ncbi:MAG: glycosyltransferase family A protein [Pseudomonadota bacterium]
MNTPAEPITVVTRTRNRAELLARAVDAMAAQTLDAARLGWVAVNDGGDPAPVEAQGARLKEAGWRVEIIHHDEAVGRSRAANIGVRRAPDGLVLLHDDDDWLAPDALSAFDASLAQMPDAVCAVGNYITVTETLNAGRWVTRKEAGQYPPYPLGVLDIAARNRFPPIAMVYRKTAFDTVGGYPEDLSVLEDWVFNLKLVALGHMRRVRQTTSYYSLRPGAEADAANSVIADNRLHEDEELRIRNDAIRKSIAAGSMDMGAVLAHGAVLRGQERIEARFALVRRAVDLIPGGKWLRKRLRGG